MEDNGNLVTLATLDTKFISLQTGYSDLKRDLANLDAEVHSSINNLGNKFETAIIGLHTKLDARSATPWQTIFAGLGVVTTVLISVGIALYAPIQRDTARLDMAVSAILDRGVFQREYTNDQNKFANGLLALRGDLDKGIQQQRYNADQERLTSTLNNIRTQAENLRARSYLDQGRISVNEQFTKDIDKRVDAISNRLAEYIRENKK